MSQSFERLLKKAKAIHQSARPSDAILILSDTAEGLQARIDVLIAAGNLTAADRPRCVFCSDDEFVAMTHDEQVFMWVVNETEEEHRRGVAEADERNRLELERLIAASENAKRDSAGRL